MPLSSLSGAFLSPMRFVHLKRATLVDFRPKLLSFQDVSNRQDTSNAFPFSTGCQRRTQLAGHSHGFAMPFCSPSFGEREAGSFLERRTAFQTVSGQKGKAKASSRVQVRAQFRPSGAPYIKSAEATNPTPGFSEPLNCLNLGPVL